MVIWMRVEEWEGGNAFFILSWKDGQYIIHLLAQYHLRKETCRPDHSLHQTTETFISLDQMGQLMYKTKPKFIPEVNIIPTKTRCGLQSALVKQRAITPPLSFIITKRYLPYDRFSTAQGQTHVICLLELLEPCQATGENCQFRNDSFTTQLNLTPSPEIWSKQIRKANAVVEVWPTDVARIHLCKFINFEGLQMMKFVCSEGLSWPTVIQMMLP